MAAATRRRALIVGISEYEDDVLQGCAEDALRMKELLEQHEDGRPNYATNTLQSNDRKITRSELRKALDELFASADNDDLLFYFAGHGAVSDWGGDLVAYDFAAPDIGGVSMHDIATLAENSGAREIVILLDCCFSGKIADVPQRPIGKVVQQARIREDMSILAASRDTQSSFETDDGGVFTSALIRGLQGAAADPLGHVTPMGLHIFASQAFARDHQQRPVFKTYHVHPPVLRETTARVPREIIDRLGELFDDPDRPIAVTAAHIAPVAGNMSDEQRDFAHLCVLRGAGMVDVDGVNDISLAADQGEIVRLSLRGRYWWSLVEENRLV